MKLKGKTALVTGGNRGIGRAVCAGLAREGAFVLVGSRDDAQARRVADVLRGDGGNADAIRLDVTDAASVNLAAARVEREHGDLHVLVNNAGVLLDHARQTENIPLDAFDATFAVNVRGALVMVQSFLGLMRRAGWGRIVNVTSGLGRLSDGMTGGWPGYRMSKAALNALTCNLAAELRGSGILVNAVDPGWVVTDMGGPRAPRSIEEGADGIVWACCLPDDGPTGKLLHNRQIKSW